jgi:hypothetical protein
MNKIWIELERPRDEAHAQQIASLANNVLRKLNASNNGEREFFWDARDRIWCLGGDMGYMTLSDNGEWFNLDWLGK